MEQGTTLPESNRILTVKEAMAFMPVGTSQKWVRAHHKELGGKVIGGRILFPPKFWEKWNAEEESNAKKT